MPQAQRLYLRVGVLVAIGLALAVGFILFLTANRLSRAATVYETYIQESVQGLEVGSAVRYRGVAIGRVTEIGLVSSEYRRPRGDAFVSAFRLVLVRFSVEERRIGEVPSVDDAIRLGLRVRLAAQGITGVSYLELDFVDPERFPVRDLPWDPRFPFIPAIPSTVAQVQSAAEDLLQRLGEVDLAGLLGNLNGLVSELREQTREGDLALALREATELFRDLRVQVDQAEIPAAVAEVRGAAAEARALLGSEEVRRTLADAAAAAAELREAAAAARALVEGPQTTRTLADVAAAAEALRAASRRLPGTLASVEAAARTARNTVGDVQSDLAPILRDLRSAIGNLRETTELLRRSPGQALFGAPPPAEGRR